MKAYFFKREKDKEVLYIPHNLIICTKNDGLDFLNLDYFPNNIKAYDLIWNSGNTWEKRKILGSAEEFFELNIEDDLINTFGSFCFKNNPINTIYAHVYAKLIFDFSKNGVESYLREE
jgi:hypothetical protein